MGSKLRRTTGCWDAGSECVGSAGCMLEREHVREAGRDIPLESLEESSHCAVQLGGHSNDDLGLGTWLRPCISTSLKVDPPQPCRTGVEHAREKNGYSHGACTQCMVVGEGWLLAGCIRQEKSASRVAHGGRPILQAWAMVCGTAASPREGDAREAALLG